MASNSKSRRRRSMNKLEYIESGVYLKISTPDETKTEKMGPVELYGEGDHCIILVPGTIPTKVAVQQDQIRAVIYDDKEIRFINCDRCGNEMVAPPWHNDPNYDDEARLCEDCMTEFNNKMLED
jgi:hypothetical protein